MRSKLGKGLFIAALMGAFGATGIGHAQESAPMGAIIFAAPTADGNFEIFRMENDGANVRPLTATAADESHPDWSPDGRHIVFQANLDEDSGIFIMDAEGGNIRRLTDPAQQAFDPSWTPDGEAILFAAVDAAGNYQIYRAAVADGALTPLTATPAKNRWPHMASTGDWIVFASTLNGQDEEQYHIYKIRPDGSDLTQLTATEFGSDTMPDWSPDAARIVFVSTRHRNSEIYTMNADGADVLRVTRHPETDTSPVFSPDGSQIGFVSDRHGGAQIYRMSADGVEVDRLTFDGGFKMTPDCRW